MSQAITPCHHPPHFKARRAYTRPAIGQLLFLGLRVEGSALSDKVCVITQDPAAYSRDYNRRQNRR